MANDANVVEETKRGQSLSKHPAKQASTGKKIWTSPAIRKIEIKNPHEENPAPVQSEGGSLSLGRKAS